MECGAGTAAFLAVNSATIVVIRGKRACIWGSIYLDSFGEEDRELKYVWLTVLQKSGSGKSCDFCSAGSKSVTFFSEFRFELLSKSLGSTFANYSINKFVYMTFKFYATYPSLVLFHIMSILLKYSLNQAAKTFT